MILIALFSLGYFYEKQKTMLKNNNPHQDNQNPNVSKYRAKIETWKRLLNSRKAGNVLLKSRLAYILKNDFDQDSLEEIEDFQTRFITEDELIDMLRKEVDELDSLQYDGAFDDVNLEEVFNSKMRKLSKDMEISTFRFNNLKSGFDDFRQKIYDKRKN